MVRHASSLLPQERPDQTAARSGELTGMSCRRRDRKPIASHETVKHSAKEYVRGDVTVFVCDLQARHEGRTSLKVAGALSHRDS